MIFRTKILFRKNYLPFWGIVFLFLTSLTFSQQSHQWIQLPKPTNQTINRVHFIDSLRGWIAGQNGLLMYTANGGDSWTQKISTNEDDVPDIFVQTETSLWATALHYPQDDTAWFGTYILHSTDGGNSWDSKAYADVLFKTIYFQDSLTGFMGGSYGTIAKTTNGGVSWYIVSDSAEHKFPVFKIKFFSKNYGYAVGGQLEIAGIIWRTTDGGETWSSKLVSGDPVFNIHYFDSLHVYASMGDIDQAGAGFLRTLNGGDTWSFENTTIWGEPTAFAFRTEAEGWVPMGIAGIVLKTNDEGFNWEEIAVPNQTPVYDISFPDEKTGFMVGYRGALFKYNSSVVSVAKEKNVIDHFSLQQNFPNPFNGTTVISYRIQHHGQVRLEIFDMLGRKIETVVDKIQSPNKYSIQWNAKNISSGVYYYRLMYGGFVKTQKMILQK